MNPISTYRIQFHKEFTFKHFKKIIPYLKKLGVSTIYASPIFESTPGSTHGYDGLNPGRINPEIGTEEDLRSIHVMLEESKIQWLQDIVPNHMAFDHRNPWLMDVLEKGKESEYAEFFDTAFSSDFFQGKLMVPFLGSTLKKAIEKQELKLDYRDEKFVLNYFDAYYPVNAASYALIFNDDNITPEEDDSIHSRLDHINASPDLLEHIADEQFYELCHWQETDNRINFRRFFTVNGLICINIQDQNVFNVYHEYLKKLVDDRVFQGLRIDHIDGLFNPEEYLNRLRTLAGPEPYIIVEKILEEGESIPSSWPIQGNSGYDFLGIVNNVFSLEKSKKRFTNFYNDLVPLGEDIEDQIHEKKAAILFQNMTGELENLYQLFISSNLSPRAVYPEIDFKTAIAYFLIYTPVYRYYGNALPLKKAEKKSLKSIFQKIRDKKPHLTSAVDILEETILPKSGTQDEECSAQALYFYQRCMQFSGPIMAKGVEDTLMYTYNRFIGHNEVGDSPDSFGISVANFHSKMEERQQSGPLSMNGTSTHDTKRGEDVRARLNVLTDIPELWFKKVDKWIKINEPLKTLTRPDANDEYLIYQTIIGAYPMPGQDEDNFPERLQEYLTKALREAKVQTSWSEPNAQYEEATKSFALKLLQRDGPFWESFEKIRTKVADFGILNSLAQTILKFTCPGVPDVYQGCELWDLSLVDPDNRRPVNYFQREQILKEQLFDEEILDQENLFEHLWNNRYSGEIKLVLTHQLFDLRQQSPELYEKGDYLPLTVKGRYKDNILAFARKHHNNWVVTVVPLHLAEICEEQDCEPLEIDWHKTRLLLPSSVPSEWTNIFNDATGKAEEELLIGSIFSSFPFAVLKLKPSENKRSAGVLLHISSLPSLFGIGDFGPEAYKFADILASAKQKYWQILPLNPTEEASMHSPYSSCSSMAGNPLLISPEYLLKEGFLRDRDLKKQYVIPTDRIDFKFVQELKSALIKKAYRRFKDEYLPSDDFMLFCEREASWLDNYALYRALKDEFGQLAWYEWSDAFKLRDPKAIETFRFSKIEQIEEIKWIQFIFNKQWSALKSYCNGLGISLFGDMPFYTSYDSADVWANPELFCLDESGRILGVAGVPPDYFNNNGQLWGMPVFRWDVLKKLNYDWWINRIKKNTELFDLIRFDHFRAFSSYWEVPAQELTARNGQWKPGPGRAFFDAVEQTLGKVPFIAEDLGDIDQPVYELRDAFNLPGMKVLQFAFGDDMPQSLNSPHLFEENFFVYTGTHDNNTMVGWYKENADKTIKQNLNSYLGKKIGSKKCAH
ncbi:malto-oligosyltrehalose synthase [Arcticibacter svalbardensis]|nr:malto-oligosyltrehalose synthase [Arcticibacter svalbardensis]